MVLAPLAGFEGKTQKKKRRGKNERMNIKGSSQNCQLRSTRRNTVASHVCFRALPSLSMACDFCLSVRYHALRCAGRSGITNQPGGETTSSLGPHISISPTIQRTESGNRNGHDGYDDEEPPPRRKPALVGERVQKAGLDPAPCQAAQLAEAAKDGRAGAELRHCVPGAKDEMTTDAGGGGRRGDS